MKHTPFLQQVARYYAENFAVAELTDLCFVFPNKRSATFFRHYLRIELSSSTPYIEPDFTDMSAFVARFSEFSEATRYESLFTLYRCYQRIANFDNDNKLPFDRFIFWGETLINDFNDVDRYLVEPDTIFTNVKRLREIGSTYLTPDQIEIIRRYWGGDEDLHSGEAKNFWVHLDDRQSHAGKRFKRLWEVLGPLYHSFIDELKAQGLTTRGRLYRYAATKAGSEGKGFTGRIRRYAFVGFNVLTTSELKIFRRLKALDIADFFWDFNSPALRVEANKAGRFIIKNIEEFPSPAGFNEERIDDFPGIDIIGVPSNVGQAKMASAVVDKWHHDGVADTADVDTAIVLPDEQLFIPMIHSMPSDIEDMNVTMGFPMRMSPVASLVSQLTALQKNARRKDGEVTGYYNDDVRHILTLPIVNAIDPVGAGNIIETIKAERLFVVPYIRIKKLSPALAPVFMPVNRHLSRSKIIAVLHQLTATLRSATNPADTFQLCFIDSYDDAVATLAAAMEEYDVEMDALTFLDLVGRAVRGETVHFTGEPLRGLQLMGVLETRALDFRNVVITSMNERIFPRRNHTRSFIPDIIRRAYGMATTDFQESIFAYYFYRLISRAERVALIYDSRTIGGIRSSEMSRYLSQLLYLFPECHARFLSAGFNQAIFESSRTEIKKTPEIIAALKRFATPGSGFALSASSINNYINCPLMFYLNSVERYNPDDEITDYIDASTYGTIIHDTLDHIYSGFSDSGRDCHITPTHLSILMKADNPLLDSLIARFINNCYYKIYNPKEYKPLIGETRVLAKVIKANIMRMMEQDKKLGDFTVKATEMRITGTMQINDKLSINIKQFIDRIDEITDADGNKHLRVVDYKTGIDPVKADSVAALFDNTNGERPKAIFQLLFYCYAYSKYTGIDRPIMPVIYKMREIINGVAPIKIGNIEVTDHRLFMPEFIERFNALVEEIFDPSVPFTPAVSDHSCKFCNFKSLCVRE